eukprot:1160451-Pelagomonas_calceolata.AAC.23
MLLLPGQHHHTLMPPCQPLPPAGDCTRGARAVHERTGAVKSSFLPRLQVTVLPLLCMIAAVRAAPAVHGRSCLVETGTSMLLLPDTTTTTAATAAVWAAPANADAFSKATTTAAAAVWTALANADTCSCLLATAPTAAAVVLLREQALQTQLTHSSLLATAATAIVLLREQALQPFSDLLQLGV